MTHYLLVGCALLAIAAPAAAQQHDHGAMPMPAPAPALLPAMPAPAPDSCTMTLAGDGTVACTPSGPTPPTDHSSRDHATTLQRPVPPMESAVADHTAMGHGTTDHESIAHGTGEGSGTARLPMNEVMGHGAMVDLGKNASLMLHGYLWPVYTDQSGPRGADKLYVQSMAMATVNGRFAGGRWMARTMLSAEPAMRHDGYPNLFATGEVAYEQPLVDRQHPHDLVMELAGRIDIDVASGTSVFLYGGPVGEPALGPSAFMHRASARYNPEAPIAHHWFDSTHIAYGVMTAGLSAPRWQIESSAFRGREPDEFRWNIETPKLDSWSLRASYAPSPAWLVQASYGQINEPEEQHRGQDERRVTASAHFNNGRGLSAMGAFSSKDRAPGRALTAWLGEVNWDLDEYHTAFGRVEMVENDELFPDHASPLHDMAFRVTKLQLGYAYRLPVGPAKMALGGTVSAFAIPHSLDQYYGDSPLGFTLFARFSFGD